ncbi:flagellar hook-basal body complex protein [Arthrobacter sp. JSM 101049]|uniref:flagellar hook-basal body complex protein n=1 Tax=Arthrobacter sp. JSM 101049 TaxID=929097 RepID=UPI003568EF5C
MLRSLYSGISGLRAHQTMLDVTGNNIANVNTAGFKSSSTQFQDTLSQMTQGGTTPQPGTAGSNPAQVGLGVQVAGVSTNFGQGSTQNTGKATDMMISGNGFFVTKHGDTTVLTRSGAFDFDGIGQLVSPDGGIVQGWMATDGVLDTTSDTKNIKLNPNLEGLESYTLGSDGTLTGNFSDGRQETIARIALGTVANPAGLQKAGGSGYTATANSGAVDIVSSGEQGTGAIIGGALEMSNVDLSQEFTNLIVAQRGFQANARIITTSDEVLQELANLKR